MTFELELEHEDRFSLATDASSPDDPSISRLWRRLQEWRSQHTAPRWFGFQVHGPVDGQPWAETLQRVLLNDPIAWVVPGPTVPEPTISRTKDLRLLLSVWTNPSLPGLKKELEALATLGDRVHIEVAITPDADALQARLEAANPDLVHFAPVFASPKGQGALGHKDEHTGEMREIATETLLEWFPERPRLIVVNTCHATAMVNAMVRNRGLMAIAWLGMVSDDRALAFALFFYGQLLRGHSPADAILRFSDQTVGSGLTHRQLVSSDDEPVPYALNPIVVIPDRASLNLQLITPPREETTRELGRGSYFDPGRGSNDTEPNALPSVPEISIHVESLDAINPALLLNGLDPLKELRINSDRDLSKAIVEVTCDTGLGRSQVRKMVDVVGGVHLLSTHDFQLPSLYELLRLDVSRRPVNFGVRVLCGGDVLAEETTSSMWMSREEWVDSKDTHQFLPAFIDPDSPAVKEIWSMASSNVKAFTDSDALDGETASAKDETKVDFYVKALYTTLRDLDRKIAYMSIPPQRVGPRNNRTRGQRVRSPERVMSDRRGTCHDLSLLFAACMEHIRLYPLVVLVSGHTFVGYWRRSAAYTRFWGRATPGAQQLILDSRDLERLVATGDVALLEATSVTKPNTSFTDACTQGLKNLARSFDAAVDVRLSRHNVDTLE